MTGPAARRLTHAGRVTAMICVLGALATGCDSGNWKGPPASSPAMPSPPDRATLQQVSLPDLSRISVSAQNQLREGYASLQGRMRAPGTTDVDLGTAYGEMGKLLMAAGYRGAAEDCFLNAEALATTDIRWPYHLGHVHQANGDSSSAAASFERALRLRPDDVPSLLWSGRADLDRGRPAEAEPRFEKALSLQPGSASALLGLGQVALAKQEYARAVQYLEQALSSDSKAGVIHYSLGMAYRGIGDVAKAEAHLRQRSSVKIHLPDPLMEEMETLLETAMAYEVRGMQALDKGEWAAAVGYLRKGIQLAPEEPSLRHKLATALALSGDTPGAIRQFEDVARRWPMFAKGQYSLGVLLAANGRPREAVDRFMAAVKGDPADVQARLQLADALQASGRLEASLVHYEQATQLDPRVAAARFGHAMALVRLKRYQDARDHLDQAMKVFPDQPGFAHVTARLLAAAPDDRARDGRRALGILQDLLSDGRPSIGLAETMAMALAEVGQYGEAARWQRDAIVEAKKAGLSDMPRMAENLQLYEQGKPCRMRSGDELGFFKL